MLRIRKARRRVEVSPYVRSDGTPVAGYERDSGIKDVLRQIASGSNLITLPDGTRITIIEQKGMNPSDRGFKTIVAGKNIIQEMQGLESTRAAAVLEGLRQFRTGNYTVPKTTAPSTFSSDDFELRRPEPEVKVWRGEGERELHLDGFDPDEPEIQAALDILGSLGEDDQGFYEPYPGMVLTPEEGFAVATIGGQWIDGSWTKLRAYAMDLRKNDKVYDVAAQDLDVDELMSPGGVTLFGDEEPPHLESKALDEGISWQTARMLSLIQRAPSSTVYRGMRVSDDVYDRLTTLGYEYDESLATATGSESLAYKFAEGEFVTADEMKRHLGDPRVGDNSIVLKINGNNVPIKPEPLDAADIAVAEFKDAITGSHDRDHLIQRQAYLMLSDERMISGRYRVADVDYNMGVGPTVIEVERVGD